MKVARKKDTRIRRSPERLEYKKQWRKRNADRIREYNRAWCRARGMRPLAEVTAELKAQAKARREAKRVAIEQRRAADRQRRATATEKACAKCEVVHPIESFRRTKGTADGREYHCRDCRKKSELRRRHSPEARLRRRRPEVLAKQRAHHINQRGRRYGVAELITGQDVQRILDTYEHRCFRCDDATDLTIDHHLPLETGHALLPGNAVLLCRSCNSLKNVIDLADFYSVGQLESLSNKFEALGSSRRATR